MADRMEFTAECVCWCQVRPVVCTLRCCKCVIHDHGRNNGPATDVDGDTQSQPEGS